MDQIAKSMEGLTIGVAITGSFCTFSRVIEEVKALKTLGAELIPIFSLQVQSTDSRFGKADTFIKDMEAITEKQGIYSITEAEPIGPKALLDVLVIMPCTGNTLAKLAVGISDTPVLMAAKAHLRNEKPLVLSISTNDAFGSNLNNIGSLMNKKHVFFVPFGQDDYKNKPNSMVAHMELIPNTIQEALHGKQIQPVIVA